MYILAAVELPEWFNYPGLEAWKFINLAVFVGAMIYVLRRPISAALATRADAIKQELVNAEAKRARAMDQMLEAQAQLEHLEPDIQSIREHVQQEAESERQRMAAATARDLEKLEQQAQREMDTADKIARKQLREFFAAKSIDVARQAIRTQMKPEDEALLIKESIGELRRTRV
jgi:F0F1-type ATP synthase membrane subunit b/b'